MLGTELGVGGWLGGGGPGYARHSLLGTNKH